MFVLRCVGRCQRHLQRAAVTMLCPTGRPVAPPLPGAPFRSSHLHPALSRPLLTTQTKQLRTTQTTSLHTTPASPLQTSPTSLLRTTLTCPLHTTQTSLRQSRQADPDYEVIYRFPYITTVRLICRLKIYQTGLTLAAVPATLLLQDVNAATKVGALGLFAACMLYIMGEFFRRFVGLIYLHRDGQQIKIAHLTFWGGRSDTVLPVEDVVPFSELKDSPADVYFKLRRYSNKETFYVSLRYGGVSSRQKLEAVFGPVEDR